VVKVKLPTGTAVGETNKLLSQVEAKLVGDPLIESYITMAGARVWGLATYEIAEEYLKELREKEIDTLVLGCTHYPILADVIQEVIGSNVKLIDSGVATAEVVKNEIHKLKLETNHKDHPNLDLFVSDIPTKFQEVAKLFLGKEVKDAVKVDLDELVH
jgi:glutamate racemase